MEKSVGFEFDSYMQEVFQMKRWMFTVIHLLHWRI